MKTLKLALALVIAFSSAAFKYDEVKAGDTVRLDTGLNGRKLNQYGRLDFRKRTARKLTKTFVNTGTVGSVLEVRKYGRHGSLALKIRLEGPEYANWSDSRRSVWVFDSYSNDNDFTKCNGAECSPALAGTDATRVQALSQQPSGRSPAEVAALQAQETAREATQAQAPAAVTPPAQARGLSASPQIIVPNPEAVPSSPSPQLVQTPVVQPIPQQEQQQTPSQPFLDNATAEIETSPATEIDRTSYSCNRNAGTKACMVCNCFYESRGEPVKGKLAVSFTVLSRANSGGYSNFPTNACGVIYQPGQFSWTDDGRRSVREQQEPKAFRECVQTVNWALKHPDTTGPMFFHATGVNPRWRLSRVERIGDHVFYTAPKFPRAFTSNGSKINLPTSLAEMNNSSRQGGAL